jgi:hypothetical protein
MQLEQTSNGVRYDWWLAGPQGAGFLIFQDHHTDKEVNEAIKELRRQRDVVTLRKANAEEIVERFIKDVCDVGIAKGLTFFQIRYDAKDLLLAMSLKSTPEEYVEKHFKKWNKNIPFKL